jgi:hypothetical protein
LINIGRGSSSPADYIARAPFDLAQFRPSWIVIQLNQADLEGDAFDEGKTHFVRHADGLELVKARPHRPRFPHLLGDHSTLANFLVSKAGAYRAGAQMPPLFRAADVAAYEAGLPNWTQRRWPTEELLDRMRAAYGGRVTFLYLPFFDAQPTPTEERFVAWCQTHAVSCIDFREAFPPFREAGRAPYGFANSGHFAVGHLNAAGHAVVGKWLALELQHVRQRGLF